MRAPPPTWMKQAAPNARPAGSSRPQPDSRRTVSRHSVSPQDVMRMPCGVTSPGWLALRKRSSMGSMPSACATSSVCDSTAKVASGLPKPRTEPPYILFVYTTRERMRAACKRYSELIVCITTSSAWDPQAL